jgi:hypothetical protein
MNALRAPLTALSVQKEESFHFWIDNADVIMGDVTPTIPQLYA